ncbi:hypothetical protein LWI29_009474 [Acer saccharum]|uniref:Uncharacterized protein n=1 Tax=Acer saccharum TaxID=4024 RepID=A0AA39T252_ACESA|nr:hypothetical protein LWI29_009474 [Acer saccharum]
MGNNNSKKLWEAIRDLFAAHNGSNVVYYKKELRQAQKRGVHKPKKFPPEYQLFSVNKNEELIEPTCVKEAIKSKEWTTAMEGEYQALIKNKTWTIVPTHMPTTL